MTDRARRAYFGIGSNLGDRLANLQSAVDGLATADGIAVVGVSSVYETEPVGGPEQPEYLNAVVAADTPLDPWQLLALAQDLETRANRIRAERWGPRTLDVDVLIVGDEVVDEPDLQVPHPRMGERGFVMAPLRDLDPRLAPEREWSGVRRTDLSLAVP